MYYETYLTGSFRIERSSFVLKDNAMTNESKVASTCDFWLLSKVFDFCLTILFLKSDILLTYMFWQTCCATDFFALLINPNFAASLFTNTEQHLCRKQLYCHISRSHWHSQYFYAMQVRTTNHTRVLLKKQKFCPWLSFNFRINFED